MTKLLHRYIGDKPFYRHVLILTLPILAQNIITNFVSLIDNIMVGRVGTEEMSGVAIVNQLIFVFNLCIFGAISGAGIFSAQFYGKRDMKGVRDTFRIKLVLVGVIAIVALLIFLSFGDGLIERFLHQGDDDLDLEKTFQQAKMYLQIILIGLPPFALMQAYSDTLRSTDESVLPMTASIVAVCVNVVLNAMLIYGICAPRLGVCGAAIATVTARFVECFIVVFWTHLHKAKNAFIIGAYRSLRVPRHLIRQVAVKGFPLLFNEALWSVANAMIVQIYSHRGLEVVSALSISSTVSSLFNCAYFALGSAIAIIIGQDLGSGNIPKAKTDTRRLMFACLVTCIVVGILMAVFAPLFPAIYNTTDLVKEIAGNLLFFTALMMPVNGLANASYFTIRSGGKTFITFLFDSVFIWVVSIPAAFLLTNFTSIPIAPLYGLVMSLDTLKVLIGMILLKSGIWLNNLVETPAERKSEKESTAISD